jgi:hypothetical protein
LASSTISGSHVEVNSTVALDIIEDSIPYGTVRSSENSSSTNATTTIINAGNTPLDNYVNGTDMTGPATIAVTNQKFKALLNFNYNATGTVLLLTDLLAPINTNKPTGVDITAPIYWGIAIPSSSPSGVYTGLNTFRAHLYTGGTW